MTFYSKKIVNSYASEHTSSVTMGSTQEMATLLAKRDARIRDLEIENMELKSKLDKYQMIFTGKLD